MAAHTCETCGLLHDAPSLDGRDSEAVMLARIAKEQAVEVARIQASADRAESRAMVDAAHEEARGDADAAEAGAAVIGEAIAAGVEPDEETPGGEPVVIDAPEMTEVDDVPDDAPPPVEEAPAPGGHRERKSRGLGFW